MKNMPEKWPWPGASRSLAQNKRKTTQRTREAIVGKHQNGCTRRIYNGSRATVEPFLQSKLISQQTVRGQADPRYLEKIIFRDEFNAVPSEFLGSLFSAVYQVLRTFSLSKNFGQNGIRCGSSRAFRWYLEIQNRIKIGLGN